MDFDIASIKKAIGMQSEDVEENDDDLMAELLALEEGDETRTTISAGSRPVQTSSAAGTSKVQVPIPARRTTASHLPKEANSTLPHLDFDSAEVEVSEADLHNDDLLSELDALVGNAVDNRKANKPAPPPTQVARNIPPSQPPPALKIHREDEAAEPQKSTPAPPPPLPPRTSSIATPTPIDSEIHQPQPKPTIEEPISDNVPDDPSQSSLETRAQSLLLRRRKLYLERAKAAKEANDRSAAVDAFETVKLFNQALEAMKEGAQLSEEDLEQIPPTPPPYAPQSEKPQQLPDSSELPGSSGMSNPEAKSQIPSKPVEKSSATEKHPPKETMPVYMSEELKLVVMRQQQLKQAALVAKQRGDLQGAKELLTLALRMDKMVEAAKCGLPIDVQQIPSAPSTSHAMPSSVSRKSSLNPETLKKYQLLEKELLKQIDMCADKMLQFQSIGDSRNVLFYESLQQNSKKDLQSVQMAMLGNSRLPNFKFVELFMPNVEVNPSIPDDQLQLKILKIEKLKLPESWKPTDCSLFVVYDFPYPHSAHQTGRTSVVKGAAVTEFPDVFHLNIKRKNPQFARIGKKTLKMEIYHKGGFLRSDKNFGHAAIPLQELEQSAHIQGRFDILEGRKKTGGFIHVEIRISKPLGHDTQMSAAAGVKRKWIKLDSA